MLTQICSLLIISVSFSFPIFTSPLCTLAKIWTSNSIDLSVSPTCGDRASIPLQALCVLHTLICDRYMQAGYEFLMCTPPLSLPFATAQGWLNHWGSLGEKDREWERLYFGGRERWMRLVFSSFVLENNDTRSNLNVSSGPEMLSLWLEVKICYWSDLSQGQFNSCSVLLCLVQSGLCIKTGLTVD